MQIFDIQYNVQCEHYEWLWTAIPTLQGQSGASDSACKYVSIFKEFATDYSNLSFLSSKWLLMKVLMISKCL